MSRPLERRIVDTMMSPNHFMDNSFKKSKGILGHLSISRMTLVFHVMRAVCYPLEDLLPQH